MFLLIRSLPLAVLTFTFAVRIRKSLYRDSKEITMPTLFVQPVTLSALSLSGPLRTIDHTRKDRPE